VYQPMSTGIAGFAVCSLTEFVAATTLQLKHLTDFCILPVHYLFERLIIISLNGL
jgi:hypothetical protein